MLKKLAQSLSENKLNLILIVVVFLYLFLTLPAILDADHMMKNLEPYPDGLFYSLVARGLAHGSGIKLHYLDIEILPNIPPAYFIYLSFFYFLNSSIDTFYLANILLTVLSIIFFYKVVKTIDQKPFFIFLFCLIFVLNAIFLFLPGLPMSENLTFFFITLAIFALLKSGPLDRKINFLILLSAIGMIFTKYAYIITGLSILGIHFFKLVLQKKYRLGIELFVIAAISGLIFYYYQQYISQVPSFNSSQEVSSAIGFSPFSVSYFYPNVKKYLFALFGFKQFFLWIRTSLVSIILMPSIVLFLFLKKFRVRDMKKMLTLVVLLFSQLVLLLFFYSTDLRYIILSIPILLVILAYLMSSYKYKYFSYLVLFLIIITQIYSQRLMLKQVVGNNIFHKSTAWQYQSILHFDQCLSDEDELITAFPPFLVDAYQTKGFQVFPLSKDQEFLQKNQHVWGDEVNYDDLIDGYRQMLESGKTLYISNAYITHQQSVIADFEEFKREFDLDLVAEGCEQACNIYQLKLKASQ